MLRNVEDPQKYKPAFLDQVALLGRCWGSSPLFNLRSVLHLFALVADDETAQTLKETIHAALEAERTTDWQNACKHARAVLTAILGLQGGLDSYFHDGFMEFLEKFDSNPPAAAIQPAGPPQGQTTPVRSGPPRAPPSSQARPAPPAFQSGAGQAWSPQARPAPPAFKSGAGQARSVQEAPRSFLQQVSAAFRPVGPQAAPQANRQDELDRMRQELEAERARLAALAAEKEHWMQERDALRSALQAQQHAEQRPEKRPRFEHGAQDDGQGYGVAAQHDENYDGHGNWLDDNGDGQGDWAPENDGGQGNWLDQNGDGQVDYGDAQHDESAGWSDHGAQGGYDDAHDGWGQQTAQAVAFPAPSFTAQSGTAGKDQDDEDTDDDAGGSAPAAQRTDKAVSAQKGANTKAVQGLATKFGGALDAFRGAKAKFDASPTAKTHTKLTEAHSAVKEAMAAWEAKERSRMQLITSTTPTGKKIPQDKYAKNLEAARGQAVSATAEFDAAQPAQPQASATALASSQRQAQDVAARTAQHAKPPASSSTPAPGGAGRARAPPSPSQAGPASGAGRGQAPPANPAPQAPPRPIVAPGPGRGQAPQANPAQTAPPRPTFAPGPGRGQAPQANPWASRAPAPQGQPAQQDPPARSAWPPRAPAPQAQSAQQAPPARSPWAPGAPAPQAPPARSPWADRAAQSQPATAGPEVRPSCQGASAPGPQGSSQPAASGRPSWQSASAGRGRGAPPGIFDD